MQNNQPISGERKLQATFVAVYPDLFDLKNPIPFKIGIFEDIIARHPDVSPKLLRRMLRWLTLRRPYLIACSEGAIRHGLEGPCDRVTSSHATYCRRKFERRNATAKDKWPELVQAAQ